MLDEKQTAGLLNKCILRFITRPAVNKSLPIGFEPSQLGVDLTALWLRGASSDISVLKIISIRVPVMIFM